MKKGEKHKLKKNILFDCFPGRTTEQACQIVALNINKYIDNYGQILLLIWTFTCDFTDKVKSQLFLKNAEVDQVYYCRKIISTCRPYGDQVKIAFLEAPYMSLSIWNQVKSGALRDPFLADDHILQEKIDQLNEELQSINETNCIDIPKFALDMRKFRKSNKVSKSSKISFGLLYDGIHAESILNKYWLRRIVNVVIAKHCF